MLSPPLGDAVTEPAQGGPEVSGVIGGALLGDVAFDGVRYLVCFVGRYLQNHKIHGAQSTRSVRGWAGSYTHPMSDYPDWQTAASTQSGNLFAAFTQTLAPGLHAGNITPVFSWASLNMIVAPSAGAGKVTVNHYADQAGTQLIGADTWDVNTATSLTVRVPLRGPYVQASINVTSGGNLTAETWGTFQTQPADRVSFPISGQIVFEATNTLAANTSKTYTVPRMTAGRANWAFVPFDNAGGLNPFIQAVDELGTVICRVVDRGNPTAIDNALLELPDQILQVVVTNDSATTAHSYGLCLVIPPQ